MNIVPLMVGGTGRSGTTILTRVLSCHTALTDVPEWRFLVDPDGLLDFIHSAHFWSPYGYDRQLKRLEGLLRDLGRRSVGASWSRRVESLDSARARKFTARYDRIDVSQLSPRYHALVDRLLEELTQFHFEGHWVGMKRFDARRLRYGSPDIEYTKDCVRRFLRELMIDVCQLQGATGYLEKNTWNILFFDRILDLLPEARMVHIHRDPRDVVASFTQQSWMPSEPTQSAVICRDLIQQWWCIRDGLPEGSYLEISLQQLTKYPRETLELVCQFWSLDFDEAMLQVDLSRSNSGRWRHQFDDVQARSVAQLVAPIIEAYGYD